MKKALSTLITISSLALFACNSDTTTQVQDSGYQPRSDSAVTPSSIDEKPTGGVGIDSIKNGQVNTNGATIPDTTKKADTIKK